MRFGLVQSCALPKVYYSCVAKVVSHDKSVLHYALPFHCRDLDLTKKSKGMFLIRVFPRIKPWAINTHSWALESEGCCEFTFDTFPSRSAFSMRGPSSCKDASAACWIVAAEAAAVEPCNIKTCAHTNPSECQSSSPKSGSALPHIKSSAVHSGFLFLSLFTLIQDSEETSALPKA